ncbi:MAG: hypothetical protein ABL958_11095, partial [Bdellovibrionia bacterium]
MITATLKRQVTLKRIVIVAYVLTVLMIAGLARASETVAMAVTNVEVDTGSQAILVEGYRSNACQRRPKPEVVSMDSRSRRIVMKIAAQESDFGYCTQAVSGHYQVVVAIPNLKLPENVPFLVEFVNAQGIAPVEVTNLGMAEGFPFSTLDLTGIVIQEDNGFLVQTRVGAFKVQQSLIDLMQYVGEVVDVSGHEIPFGLM